MVATIFCRRMNFEMVPHPYSIWRIKEKPGMQHLTFFHYSTDNLSLKLYSSKLARAAY